LRWIGALGLSAAALAASVKDAGMSIMRTGQTLGIIRKCQHNCMHLQTLLPSWIHNFWILH